MRLSCVAPLFAVVGGVALAPTCHHHAPTYQPAPRALSLSEPRGLLDRTAADALASLCEAAPYLSDEADRVEEALQFAAEAHAGQTRKSGSAFIVHPIETATILADLRMDCDTVVAGLLHDTVEDTPTTLQ